MALDTTAVVTVAEAKAYLEISGAAKDEVIEDLANGCSLYLENWCSLPLIQRQFTEKYTGGHPSKPFRRGGHPRVYLKQWPVSLITSITDPASNTVASTDYVLMHDIGVIEVSGGWPAPFDTNGNLSMWSIVYTAGWFANTAAVTSDVKLACNILIASVLARKQDDITKIDIGSGRFDFPEDKKGWQMPNRVRTIMGKYKGNRIV